MSGEGRKNEGTGLAGRVEGSLEQQDWKDGITREIRNLRRLAIFCFFQLLMCVREKCCFYIGD